MTKLAAFLNLTITHAGINDKAKFARKAAETIGLTKDRSVYYCDEFAVRFSSGSGPIFSNTVLSLSNLRKVDHLPFLVCVVTPLENHILLANSTFLRKISHSSQQLRIDNIRGSFNGSDIMRDFEGISNCPANILRLYAIHREIGFEDNLPRLVESTNNITATGHKFIVTTPSEQIILDAPKRAARFVDSPQALTLKAELDERVERFKTEILVAAMIENVNIRGRVIEFLLTGEDDTIRDELVDALLNRRTALGLPSFKTANRLGDYQRVFDEYFTETDVKTKIMVLSSNPKAYNLDKILEFLAREKSVFLFYFVGVHPSEIISTTLVSMFQSDLLSGTILLKHWSGRNSRGVAQFDGSVIETLIRSPRSTVQLDQACEFLKKLLAL